MTRLAPIRPWLVRLLIRKIVIAFRFVALVPWIAHPRASIWNLDLRKVSLQKAVALSAK